MYFIVRKGNDDHKKTTFQFRSEKQLRNKFTHKENSEFSSSNVEIILIR